MGATRFRRAEALALALLAAALVCAPHVAIALLPPSPQAPVIWHEDDRRDIPQG